MILKDKNGNVLTKETVPNGKNAKDVVNEYHVLCMVCAGVDDDTSKCHACGGKGYNLVTFKNGRRIK